MYEADQRMPNPLKKIVPEGANMIANAAQQLYPSLTNHPTNALVVVVALGIIVVIVCFGVSRASAFSARRLVRRISRL